MKRDQPEEPDRPVDTPSLPTAGPLRRTLATVVDMVVFTGLSAALLLPLASSIEWTASPERIDELARELSNPSWLSHASGIAGLWMAFWWSYFVVGWGMLGATPGKWLFGLRVVDYRDRCPIGPTRGFLRLAAYMVSSCTLCCGHLMVLFRPDRRALHDILAGTRVVKRR